MQEIKIESGIHIARRRAECTGTTKIFDKMMPGDSIPLPQDKAAATKLSQAAHSYAGVRRSQGIRFAVGYDEHNCKRLWRLT